MVYTAGVPFIADYIIFHRLQGQLLASGSSSHVEYVNTLHNYDDNMFISTNNCHLMYSTCRADTPNVCVCVCMCVCVCVCVCVCDIITCMFRNE